MKFHVTNPDGSEPDFRKLRKEEWAKHLRGYQFIRIYFVVEASGKLLMIDALNKIVECPPGRFVVHFEEEK